MKVETNSVRLAPQEGRDLDTFLIGGMFGLVIIRGDGRLLACSDGAFCRAFGGLIGKTACHAVDQTADAEARTFGGFRRSHRLALHRSVRTRL